MIEKYDKILDDYTNKGNIRLMKVKPKDSCVGCRYDTARMVDGVPVFCKVGLDKEEGYDCYTFRYTDDHLRKLAYDGKDPRKKSGILGGL